MQRHLVPILLTVASFFAATTAHAGTYTDSTTKTYSKAGATKTFKFANLPPAVTPVTVGVDLWGEYESANGVARFADVDIDGAKSARMCDSGCSPNCNTTAHSDSFQVAASRVADGELVVTVQNSENAGLCRRTKNEIRVRIEYGTNDAPTARDGEVRLPEDTQTTIQLQASDPDGDTLTWEIVTQPTNGTLSGSPPNLTYEPDANYNGSDQFEFHVDDGAKTSNVATVDIVVEPVNDPPTWVAPQQSTFETVVGEPFELQIEAEDVDGDDITYAAEQQPAGSTFDPARRRLEWTPALGQLGSNVLQFSATDGQETIFRQLQVDVVAPEPDVADRADTSTRPDTASPDTGDEPSRDTSFPTSDTATDTGPRTTYSLRGSGCSLLRRSTPQPARPTRLERDRLRSRPPRPAPPLGGLLACLMVGAITVRLR